MTVGTAHTLLQMSDKPIVFGCAEVVANRLARCTAGGPACALRTVNAAGHPQFVLTEYGKQVKEKLETWICLSAN